MNATDWTLLLVPAVSIPAVLWLGYGRSPARVTPEAMATCGELLRLLGLLQQHRGLSSGWLSGDASFEARMMARRQDIDAVLARLSKLLLAEEKRPRPCMTGNDLALFRHQWHVLTDSLADGSVEQSIGRHTRMIASVLDWLAAFGEARIELAAGRQLPAGRIRNYTHRLPALTECLGQARALGSSVAVRKGCPPVARVRLMFLMARAETLLEQACAGDDVVARQAVVVVRGLVATVRTGMLMPSGVALGADAYFAQATQAIDGVFAWARECGRAIERELGVVALPAGSEASPA